MRSWQFAVTSNLLTTFADACKDAITAVFSHGGFVMKSWRQMKCSGRVACRSGVTTRWVVPSAKCVAPLHGS